MPAVNKLTVNTRLTNVSVELKGGTGFIADELAPILPVRKKTGEIMEADQSNLQADPDGDDRIGQGEPPPILKGDFSTLSYNTVERARGATVHDDEVDADNAEDAPYEVKVRATERATMRLLRNREVRVKALALAAATGASPATKWDQANSDPVADVRAQKVASYQAIGIAPNYMSLPWLTVEHLRENAVLRKYFEAGSTRDDPSMVDVSVLRKIFGIPNIVIADASIVAGNVVAGPKTGATISSIWVDDVMLWYRPQTPRRWEPAFMYTYAWSNAFHGAARNDRGQYVTEHYEKRARTLYIDARMYQDEKALVAAAGRKLTNVLNGV